MNFENTRSGTVVHVVADMYEEEERLISFTGIWKELIRNDRNDEGFIGTDLVDGEEDTVYFDVTFRQLKQGRNFQFATEKLAETFELDWMDWNAILVEGFLRKRIYDYVMQLKFQTLPVVDELDAKISIDDDIVRLHLNLSQEERAIVDKYGLDEKIYLDEPYYTKEQLDEKIARFEQIKQEATPETLPEVTAKTNGLINRDRQERLQLTILDFLSFYERQFPSRYQATLYAEKLEKIIYQVKADIDRYKTRAGR